MANTSNRLLNALLRIDPTTGFIDYVKTVKPYHTKILDVSVAYIWTDLIGVTVTEQYDWDMQFVRPDVQTVYDCGFGTVYDPPFGYAHTQYFLNGVVPGAGGSWTISGNHQDVFFPGSVPGYIFVVGLNNGGGNGFYTVVSASDVGPNTVITTLERIGAGYNIVDTVVGHGGADPTGLTNGTTYTATITIDGVHVLPVSFTPTVLNHAYSDLLAAINTAIAGFGIASFINGFIRIESNTTGAGSSVLIVDTGPNFLFVSLTGFIAFSPVVGATPTPQGLVYLFDITTNDILSTDSSTSPYPLADSFLLQGPDDWTQKYFEGALIVVDDTDNSINNGEFIVQSSQFDGANTRVWVKEYVNDIPPTYVGTGRMYLDREGYDEPPYCRLAQASDLHADVFIHEHIEFVFDDMFGIQFFDLITSTVVEDSPGDPSFNGKLPPTALTTAIVLLPTGVDGNPFDMGGLDESVSTVSQFYGLTID